MKCIWLKTTDIISSNFQIKVSRKITLKMSFSFEGPLPSTSSPSREGNPSASNNFNSELGSFLVSLSRTEDMSSLEQQLRRLKMAWKEISVTGESGEGKNVNSKMYQDAIFTLLSRF